MWDAIRAVKSEGLLRLSGMTIGMWYRALLDIYVTHEIDDNGFQFKILSNHESTNPDTNWESAWEHSTILGLTQLKV